MKVQNVRIQIDFPASGTEFVADGMSNSFLRMAGLIPARGWEDCEYVQSFAVPAFVAGDKFDIAIPSGTLTCEVVSAQTVEEYYPQRVVAIATWEGSHGGFLGGLCAFASWTGLPDDVEMVETSIAPHPIAWRQYQLARDIAQYVQDVNYASTPRDAHGYVISSRIRPLDNAAVLTAANNAIEALFDTFFQELRGEGEGGLKP